MTVEILRSGLGWCAVFNMGLLMWWFLFLALAHDWVYRMHSKWYTISKESFGSIHYAGMTFFKVTIFAFNIIPYFALRRVE
jgi:hypothetical protein